MLLRYKKGMEAGFLVALIITILGGLIIGGVVIRFMSNATDKEAENLCHDSVALRAKTGITHEGTFDREVVKMVPALCKTLDQKIDGEREELKEKIAYKIARCWWMFGEGRYEELLDSSEIAALPSVLSFDKLKNDCFVCYNFMIDEKEIASGGIPSWEMVEYLSTHNHPLYSVTYLDYIQTYAGPGKIIFGVEEFLPGTGYGISMMPKNSQGEDMWVSATKLYVGGALMILGGGPGPLIIAASGFNNIIAKSSEREFSIISIQSSMDAQNTCGSADLAGE